MTSGTKRNGTPLDTTCTGSPVPATAASDRPTAAAAPAGFAIGSENVGLGCVIHAKDKSLSFHVSDTGTGPIPRPNTKRWQPGSMTPARASANALPMVGCPAMGSSSAGVKIRIRTSVSVRSGGSTKVVSENAISFAIACMVTDDNPRPSRTTASWLPPNT